MAGHEEQAFKYRQKAEELRAIIPETKDKQSRETLENLAVRYDQLANAQDNHIVSHNIAYTHFGQMPKAGLVD